jgi:DNA-binding response OmpR family regulator
VSKIPFDFDSVKLIKANSPDIILISSFSEDVESINKLALELKSDKETLFLPIMIILDKENTDYVIESYYKGAEEVVGKDINPSILVSKIDSLFRIKKLYEKIQKTNESIVEKKGSILIDEDYAKLYESIKSLVIEMRAPVKSILIESKVLSNENQASSHNHSIIRIQEKVYKLNSVLDNLDHMLANLL